MVTAVEPAETVPFVAATKRAGLVVKATVPLITPVVGCDSVIVQELEQVPLMDSTAVR